MNENQQPNESINPNNTPLIDRSMKGIPNDDIMDLYQKGLTQSQIAKLLDCSPANICQRMAGLKPHIRGLQTYKDNRADIMAAVQRRFINSITDADIKKAPAASRVTAMAILYDKERLERGQSTANLQFSDIMNDIKALDAEIERATAQISQSGNSEQSQDVTE